MRAIAAEMPRQGIRETDLVLLAIWAGFAFLEFALKPPVFMAWAVAGGALMVCRHLYTVVYRGRADQGDLVVAAIMPALVLCTGLSAWIVRLTPVTIDRQLAALDLGAAPAVRTWTLAHPQLYFGVWLAYGALPFFVVACAATMRRQERIRLGLGIMLGGLLVPAWYLVFPAVGPIHVGEAFAPRNCMPSMHVTWALLAAMSCQGRARLLAGAFVAVTAWATLATGEHYLPDLIVALPWAWALSRAAGRIA